MISYLKNFAVASTMLFVPLKSGKVINNHRSIDKYIVPSELVSQLYKRNDALKDFSDLAVTNMRKADIAFFNNFPKVTKPSINMDVSKSRYTGSPKYLDMFLTGVLKGKGKEFCKAQEKYGIDATFLIGIANHESGMGKSEYARMKNNIAGMRNSEGYIYFKSVDECIDKMASNLKKNYIDKGYTTISKINTKYAGDTVWGDYIVKHITPIYNQSKCMIYDFR